MKRSLLFILVSVLFLNLYTTPVNGATDTYRPTLDELGQCVHGSLSGEFDDYSWAIFIGNDQFDTAAGIRFPNITIEQGEIINDANLTVYYPGGYDWNTGTLYLLIYGYDADNAPDDLTWSDIVNGPRTKALTIFNISYMNTTDYYIIDVTDHVQEIVNRYNWESGNSIAFTTLHILDDDAGEYWYEWASNTGAYKNHRPSLTVRHSEEPDTGPGEGYEYNGTYQGYDIWFYNDTVTYWGLANPNYWVDLPVTVQVPAAEVTVEDAETYNSSWIQPDLPYGEPWGNTTYKGNYYHKLYHVPSSSYDTQISRCESSDIGSKIKVGIFGFERTWGTQVGTNIPILYVAGYSNSYSGTFGNRVTNSKFIVATEIRDYDNDEVEVNVDSSTASAEAQGPDLYLTEGTIYLMKYWIVSGANNYGGHKYLYHYRNNFYIFNQSTASVSYYGRVEYHFNASDYNTINRVELLESYGGGAFDVNIEAYVSRGFNPEIEYKSYFEIWKNGTKITDFPENSTIDDITDYIDDLFDTTDPENPSAGSRWTGSEPWYLDRNRTQLYFTIFGLGFIIPPWIIAAHKRRIDIIVTALLLNVLGIALLYGVGYI